MIASKTMRYENKSSCVYRAVEAANPRSYLLNTIRCCSIFLSIFFSLRPVAHFYYHTGDF